MEENMRLVVLCKDCVYYNPPHILLNNGTERPYTKEDDDIVSIDVGINVGGKCEVDKYSGYDCDKTVFRKEDDFCSKGQHKDYCCYTNEEIEARKSNQNK